MDEYPVQPCDSDPIKSPLTMTKYTAWADNQVISERSNGGNFRSAYKNTKRVMFNLCPFNLGG
jgi:hypothetical protein